MTQIPPRAASRFLNSVAFLNDQHGVLFNAMITLNFDQLGLATKAEKARAFTRFNLSLAGKLATFSNRGFASDGQHFFAYVHERVLGIGHHIHQAAALPPGLRPEFEIWLQKWRLKHYPSSSHRAVHPGFPPQPSRIEDRVALQARLIRYMLKTTAPSGVIDRRGNSVELHNLLGLKKDRKSQPIDVRRLAGVSQNLTMLAQWDVGYQPPLYWEDMLSEDNFRRFYARRRSEELQAQLRAIEV